VAIVLGDLPHQGVSILAGANIDGIDRKPVIDEPLRLPSGPRADFEQLSWWTERRYHAPEFIIPDLLKDLQEAGREEQCHADVPESLTHRPRLLPQEIHQDELPEAHHFRYDLVGRSR
jgi:hypothetical protein